MLHSYFENAKVGMTKEMYYQACEAFGEEPSEENTPVEFEDLPVEIQYSFSIYNTLRDDVDTMNGRYLGKDISTIGTIFEIYDIEKVERKFYLDIINKIDNKRKSVLNASREKPASK
jgi:hypothetical protein